MNKKARMKGGIILSFCLVFLCSTVMAIFGIAGFGMDSTTANAEGEEAIETTALDDGSSDTQPANPGDGTQANPYILWGDTENKAKIWADAMADSLISGSANKIYVKLGSNWIATENEKFVTSFAGADNFDNNLDTASSFVYGCIAVPQGANVELDLNGYRIDRGLTGLDVSNGMSIMIGKYATFDLRDSNPSAEHTITYGSDWNGTTLTTAECTVSGGLITGGGTRTSYGGGVYLRYGATFNMYGGNISGNMASAGAGVNLQFASTFNMYGGNISYNLACTTNGGNGGGVGLEAGSEVNLYGGSIHHNVAYNGGGGVSVNGASAKLNIEGGDISYNRTIRYEGGGVYAHGLGITVTMSDGSVNNNASNNGGGLYVRSGAKFFMTGGTVSYNTSKTYGGGFTIAMYITNADTETTYAVITGGSINYNTSSTAGGGIAILNGTEVTLSGTAEVAFNDAPGGGGVYISAASYNDSTYGGFNMNGGSVHDNTVNGGGAGISINMGTFNFTAGEIYHNTTKLWEGGAVFCSAVNARFNMSGGKIYGNWARNRTGGVFIRNSTANISGGEIFGNSCGNYGNLSVSGALVIDTNSGYAHGGVLNLSGNLQVYDNVYNGTYDEATKTWKGSDYADLWLNTSSSKVNIVGKLESTAHKIGVRASEGGIVTNGWGRYHANDSVSDYFFANDSSVPLSVLNTTEDSDKEITVGTNTRVAVPTWPDLGSQTQDKYVYYEGGDETVSFVDSSGAELKSIRRYYGNNSDDTYEELDIAALKAAGKLAFNSSTGYTDLTVSSLGQYVLTFGLKSGYQGWIRPNMAIDTSDKTLTFSFRQSIAVPTWGDNTTTQKYFTYTGGAIEVPYIAEHVTVTVNSGGTVGDGFVSGVNTGVYTATFALANNREYCWSRYDVANKTLRFCIRKAVALPTFDNGNTVVFIAPTGASANFTAYSEGVTVTVEGGELSGNTVTLTGAGTAILTFTITNTNNLVWADNTTAAKTITVYAKTLADAPKWAEGGSSAKYFDSDGTDRTVNFVKPDGVGTVTVTVGKDGEPTEITGTAFTASAAGTYTLTFWLEDVTFDEDGNPVDGGTHMWKDGSTALFKTLTFYISKVVQQPMWDDGSTGTKTFPYQAGVSQHIVNIPDGVKIITSTGVTVDYEKKEVRAELYGTYTLTYRLEEGYIWRGNVTGDKTLTFYISKNVPVPVWSTGLTTNTYVTTYEDGSVKTATINKDAGVSAYFVQIYDQTASLYYYTSIKGNGTYELDCKGGSAKITVTDTAVELSVNFACTLEVRFYPLEYGTYWENTTSAGSLSYLFKVFGSTKIATPAWADGSTSAVYLPYDANGAKISTYELPEGVKILSINGNNGLGNNTARVAFEDNVITAYDKGSYVVTFALTDTVNTCWNDLTTANKTLTFYVVEYVDYPVWTDDAENANKYVKSNVLSANGYTLTVPESVKVTCSNPNATISRSGTTVTVKATAVGSYALTFALPNTTQYRWTDTTSVSNVTCTLYITGSTEVDLPTFEDGTTAVKTCNMTGYGESNPYTFVVNVPQGATLTQVINADGLNGSFKLNGDGTATVYFKAAGYYCIRFIIDTENYVWADESTAANKDLNVNARYELAIPTWDDNTRDNKYFTYDPNGIEVGFIVSDSVIAASCTNTDARIEGNKVYATEPGTYTISFNVSENKYDYMWSGSTSAGFAQTLTFYITGGKKVVSPTWTDGTTDAKYATYTGSQITFTANVPEGATVTVMGNSSTPTVSVANGVATIKATTVGTYTVKFTIDTTEYVWADNSVSDNKTLTFYITAKEFVDFPTWGDGSNTAKYISSTGGSVSATLKYSAADVDVAITDADGATVGSINGMNITVPEAGTYKVTFSLKNPAAKSWQNNTTAPRTLTLYVTEYVDVPEWSEGGTDAKYLAYDENGQTVSFTAAANLTVTLGYRDTNGITRAMTLGGDGKTWTGTLSNGTAISAVVENGTVKASAAGTYILTFALPDNTKYMWAGTTSTADRTLTFTVNPEDIIEVPLPEWSDGGSEDKYVTFDGTSITVAVKDGLNYVISAVSGGATFSGNEITVNGIGQYTVTLSLANVKKYVWEGGESGTKTLTLYSSSAEAEEMAVPTWSDGTTEIKGFTYDANNAQSVTIKELGAGVEILSVSNGVSQSGNTFTAKGSPTGTVTYTITFKLKNTTDYKWSDQTTSNKTLKFTIIGGKTVVNVPDDVNVVYNGSAQTFEAPASSAVSVVSATNGAVVSGKKISVTDVGTYVVTLRLTSTADESFVWSTNSVNDIKWTINVEKADVDTSAFKLNTFSGAYDGKAHPATVSGLPDFVTAVYTYTDASGKPVTADQIKNAGTYTVNVSFTHSNANYNAIKPLSGTIRIDKVVLSVQWKGQSEYNYNNGNPVSLSAEVFGVVSGESNPYTVLLNGASAAAGSAIGDYTAVIKLNSGVNNYTFAGNATQVTYAYAIKNLSTVVTKVNVSLKQTDITVSNTDELDVVKQYIDAVTVTYDNGYSETVTDYTLSGDFGAANPYFAVCYGNAKSDNIAVTVPEVVDLTAIRVEEVENVTTSTTVAQLRDLLTVTATYSNGTEKTLDASAVKLLENGVELNDSSTLSEGKHTITVSYTQGAITKTDTVQITVEGVKLTGITAQLAADFKIYESTTVAELKAALTVTAEYSDNSTATVGDYTIDPVTFTAGSPYTITVRYNGETATISGTVEATAITSITAEWLNGSQTQSGIPPVYSYTNLEDLRNYIVVKANGTDAVTGYLLSGTLVADSECDVTVTYADHTATLKVKVAATPSTVTFKEVRADFNQGNTVIYTSTAVESLKSLLTVEEVYLNGSEEIVKVITDYTLSGTLTAGTSTLTVNYTDSEGNARSATFSVNVTAVELDTLTVAWKNGTQPVIYNTLTLDELKGMITVTGAYNNGTPYPAITENDFTLSGELSAGKAEITVTVAGKSATFEVNVTAVELTGITVSWKDGSQGNYKIYTATNPEELKNHIVVKAIYNNNAAGVELNANEYAISAEFVLGNDTNPVTVTYNGKTQSINVKVEGSELTGIIASYNQSGTVYSSNTLDDLYTKGTLTVTAKFSGGVADATLVKGDYELTGDLTKGACTITVTYNGKTATFTVDVTEVTLVSIGVSFDKTAAGKVFTTTDIQTLKQYLTVTATYGDTSTKRVEADSYVLSGNLEDGKLTVTYNGKTAEFEITAESIALESISASYDGTLTVYATTGLDELRKNLTVTAVYNDKSQAEITDYELSGKLSAGKVCTITVSYNGKIATFDVTVEAKTLVSITANWTSAQPTVYPYTDVEDLRSALTVTATFNYGDAEPVTDYEISGDLKSPSAQITITYGGRTATLNVNVTTPAQPVEMELSATFAQGNVKIYEGASLDSLEGYLTVTAKYGSESKNVQAGAYALSGTLVAGECTVTVTYEGKTATFTVEVSAIELANITAEFTQQGEVSNSAKLEDLQTLVVTAHYTNGTGRTLNANEYTLSGDLVAGAASEITVTYQGRTATFTVNVAATPVTFTLSASFDASAFGNVYTSTSVEDLRASLTVTANYSNGTDKTVTGYEFVTASLTSGNSVSVTVSYQGETAQFTLTVLEVEIAEIAASFNQGTNKIYTSSALADLAQYLTVTGVNNDGTAFGNITLSAGSYELSGELKAGKSVITVTLLSGDGAGKSATFEVDVTGVKIEELRLSFNAGNDKIFSTANLDSLKKYFTVTAVYNDGETKLLTAADYTLSGNLVANQACELTVTYNGVSNTQTVQVEAKELSRIEVSYDQKGTLYSNNTLDDLLSNGTLTVTAYYNDGSAPETVTSGYTLSGSLTSGMCLITVTYGGKTDTFEASVTAITLVNVTVELNGNAPEFFTTTSLEAVAQYLTVTANYSNGTHKTLNSDEYALSGTLSAGTSKLTVSYDGKTANVSVNVTAVKLEGIAAEASELPAVFANTNINDLKAYLTVSATYTDGKIVSVTDYELTGTLVAGETCTLTVSYGGQTTSFDVRVETKQLARIEAQYTGGSVSAATALGDLSVSVTAYYTDGTSAIITEGYTLTGTLEAGKTCTVTVTYGDKSATVTVTVDNSVTLDGITVTLAGNAEIYTSTALANLKSVLKVEEVYSDGTKKTVPANGYTLSGSLATAGERNITVTLVSDTTKTAQITVNVLAVELQSITAVFDAESAGEILITATLDSLKAYLTVSGVNNDGGEIAQITGYTLSGDIAEGECTITVEYLGKLATFTINVSNKDENGGEITLKGITATANVPANVSIYPNAAAEDLREYLTVNAIYTTSGGDITKAITGYTFITSNVTLKDGKYVVTVEFDGKQADAEITVTPVALAQISANFNQNGAVIYTSASLDSLKQYLTVTGINNDGTLYNGGAAITSGYTLSGELSAGKCRITVMYQGITATFTVEVTAVTISGITVTLDETNLPVIYTTTSLDSLKQYLTVVANYSDNSAPKTVSPADYKLSGELLAGKTCTVTVTYNGVSDSFDVQVAASVLTSITASYNADGSAPEIFSSTSLESLKAYLEVTAQFSVGEPLTLGSDDYELTGDLTKGACTITVTYNGKTATFTVNVTEVTLVTLGARFDAANAPEIFSSTSLESLRGYLTVTAGYSDGESKEITEYTFDSSVNLHEGANTVTVNYGGKSASFTLNVTGVKLGGIAAVFDKDNAPKIFHDTNVNDLRQWLAVTASYTDNKLAAVYDYELTGTLEAGKTCTLTVSYGGKTATFDVTVEKKSLVSITAVYSGDNTVENTVTLDDLMQFVTVTAHYDDGTQDENVTGFTLSGTLSAGPATVTVNYGGKTDTFSLTVTATYTLNKITADFVQGNTRIYAGKTPIDSLKNMLSVSAHFVDGNGYSVGSKLLADDDYTLSGTLSAGTATVTVNYGGLRTQFTVNVTAIELDSLTAVFDGSFNVTASTPLNGANSIAAHLTVKGLNNDGTLYNGGNPISASDFVVSGDLVAGQVCTLTVTVANKSVTFEVSVSAEITFSHITVTFDQTALNGETVYTSSDISMLVNGITVTAHYSNGSTRIIEYPNYTFTCDLAGSGDGDGDATIYVSYGTAANVEAVGKVAVKAVKVAQISASFNQNGEPVYTSATLQDVQALLDANKVTLSVVGINNDGTFAGTLTGYTLTNMTSSGEVTVSYNGITTTFNVILINNNLNGLDVSLKSGVTADDIEIYTSQSLDKLKDYIAVQAFYTGDGWKPVNDGDYTLSFAEKSRDGEAIVYEVTVNYFTQSKKFGYDVKVRFVKLSGVTVTLDPAYKNSNVVIYDSMSAADAAALLENYLTITGTYNDGTSATLALGAFIASGNLSVLNPSNEAEITLTYATDSTVSGAFTAEVTRVAFSNIEIEFHQPNTAKVYSSQTLADLKAMLAAYDLELDVTAYFNNGSSRVLDFSDYEISADASELNADGTLKAGTRTIKVTYTHGTSDTKTFEVKVEEVGVKSLTATLNGNTVYTATTLADFYKMITVTAVYNNDQVTNPDSTQYSTNLTVDKPFMGSADTQVTVVISFGSLTYDLKFTVQKTVITIDTSGISDYTFNPALTTQEITGGAKLMLGGVEVTDATASLVYSNNTFATYSDLTNGKITITISFAGDSVYASASTTCEVTVNKAQADLTGFGFLLDGTAYGGSNITYNDTAHTLDLGTTYPAGITGVTYAYTFTKHGDTAVQTVTAGDIKNAGTYTVTATLAYNENYTGAATLTATLVIEKAQAEIDITNVKDTFTYTGLPQTVTGATLAVGDATQQTITYTVGTTASGAGFTFTHVSEGNGVTVTVSVPASDNYLGQSKPIHVIVNKAALNVTANAKTIEYGDQPSNNGVTVSGLQNGETLDSLGVTISYSYNYAGTGGLIGDVGEYEINVTAQGGNLDDYNVTFTSGKLTVTEKEVDVDWSLTDVTYDGQAHKPLATFVNIYGNPVVLTVQLSDTVNGTLTNGEAINAGTYAATVTSSNKNYKYSAATKDYSFVIKAAPITVTKSGDSWFMADDLFNDRDALMTLDKAGANGKYEYIGIAGDQTAAIEIRYSTQAHIRGTEPQPSNDTYALNKPRNISAAGSYVINYKITVANHEVYFGAWALDILDDTDPDAKFIQIIFTKPYVFEYGTLPETQAELEALAEELYDGYIDTDIAKLKFTKAQFLANVNLVLKADNENVADKDTGYGSYTIYFEWKDNSQYAADWVIAYKDGNLASDSNVGKLQIVKKQLTATWSDTSFIADGTVHLPKLTISGFNDGSVYELTLTSAESGTYTIEKDGRKLVLSVDINGNLSSAGAHIITVSLDNANYLIDGAITAISVTAPTIITVTWDNTSFVSDGTVHLPTATVSDGTNTATLAITQDMVRNGGGTVEITLGSEKITVKVTIGGTGNLLSDIGDYTITLTIEDNRYTLPAGSTTVSVTAPAPAPEQEGLSPLEIGIIVAVSVLALLIIIIIIVVIKRKPSVIKGDDDGFDDYIDED